MKNRRLNILAALAKGLAAAIGITLAGMLLIAAAVIFTDISDNFIRALDQILKICAVSPGTLIAVGRGGERGLLTGAALGAAYAVAGYIIYMLLGGYGFDIVALMGEMTVCIAAGALSGVICANMAPKRARSRA